MKNPLEEKPVVLTNLADLRLLPPFAEWLLHQQLSEYISVIKQVAHDLSLPMLQQLQHMPEEALENFVRQSVTDQLQMVAQHRTAEYITQSAARWRANEIPNLQAQAISSVDVTLFAHVRKQAMLHFAPAFCNNTADLMQLVRELDFYTMKSEHASFETYVELLRRKLEEQADISIRHLMEQHRIEQELKNNQAFLQRLTDAAPSIITSFNIVTGKYVFVSNGLRTLLGYEPQALLDGGNEFFKSIIHPSDAATVLRKKEEILTVRDSRTELPEPINTVRYRMCHSDGRWRWLQTYTTVSERNEDGSPASLLNITTDVTEHEETLQRLKEQEQFIQNIADASPTILYVYDVSTASFLYVNRELYFVLGYMPEEVTAMGNEATALLYHPDDFALLPERPQSERQIAGPDVMMQYECRIRSKVGEWRWFLVREVVLLTDDRERPLQIVGAALDISKRKEMEQTLMQNALLLEQSNASLEEFAFVASHDLKEPLRKISNFGDRLALHLEGSLSPEGEMYLSKIIDASQRMQTMVSDILSISLISGNKSFERCSLQKLLDETLQTLETKIEQVGAIITSDSLPEAVVVIPQFRQLFQNLIANSLKFIVHDVQPHIRITHAFLSGEEVRPFGLSGSSRYLQLQLRDNGIGFENEYAGKIFLLFQRLHGRSEYEGSGMGLAICKKIVEHHGGIIYASGESGLGAIFTILLPAEQSGATTESRAAQNNV